MSRTGRSNEPLIFELSKPGRRACEIAGFDAVNTSTPELDDRFVRQSRLLLPEVDELTVVRHFTRLSQMNFSVDTNFYPLGSCTMKYNPKVNEEIANMSEFCLLHPYQDQGTVQGLLQLLYTLQSWLAEIAGLPAVTLQPAAGAQGEFTALLLMRAYYRSIGETERIKTIIPDSAHGTNPASAARCGFSVIQVASGSDGCVDLKGIESVLGSDVACVMITNPNTLGMFEKQIVRLSQMTHEAGAFVYLDGANMNAIMGKAKPGVMGCDAMHFNLHKTFSTPHGGGGPGAGPVAVSELLQPFLPVPVISRCGNHYYLDYDRPLSVGQLHTYYGNVGVLLRAYCYIRQMGAEGLTRVSEDAVLNANYLLSLLDNAYTRATRGFCMHEFVVSASGLRKDYGISALDVCKRLLDSGLHAPTMYFPLNVKEALMIEPTETENRMTIEQFANALNTIVEDAKHQPDTLRSASHTTPLGRLDEAKAARELDTDFTRKSHHIVVTGD